MTYQQTFALESDKLSNPELMKLMKQLGDVFSKHDIKLLLVDLEYYSWNRCKELIIGKGASCILSTELVEEAVLDTVPKNDVRSKHLLVKILAEQLKSLLPTNDLIIVDAYLFWVNNPNEITDLLGTLEEILSPIICGIQEITFVTKPDRRYDLVAHEAEKRLYALHPTITLKHKHSEDFHDRFWIVDKSRGMFVGASLNGIGKKYALTDFISDADTASIVTKLRRLGIVT